MINMRGHNYPDYCKDNWSNYFDEYNKENSYSKQNICKVIKETYETITTRLFLSLFFFFLTFLFCSLFIFLFFSLTIFFKLTLLLPLE